MKNKTKITILITLLVLTLIQITPVNAEEQKTTMHFFWDEGCPHCTNQKPYNELLQQEFENLEIKSYEPFKNQEARTKYFELTRERGIEPRGVPLTIINDKVWQGFSQQTYEEIKKELQNTNQEEKPQENIIQIPLLGMIDLNATPIIAATILIAIMDGFNPCSLWLLLFLLGILILTKSRKKMLLVGLTFLTVTATVYGLFIAGVFSIFSYVTYHKYIAIGVGLLALFFAIINIKDYFWYKKGISLTISDKHKPKLFKKIRNIMHPENSTPQMMGATALLALGVTLVELPCTAGLPMIWVNLLATHSIAGAEFLGLIIMYLLLYLGIEIMILLSAIITMNKFEFQEKHGRVLKLVSGIIMLLFGYGFVFNYNSMNSLGGLFTLILQAITITLIIIVTDKFIIQKIKNKNKTKKQEKQEKTEKKNKKNKSKR